MQLEETYSNIYNYISSKPGCSINDINTYIGKNVQDICDVWVKNYTSFFDIGRIINRDEKYFVVTDTRLIRQRLISNNIIIS